MMRFLFLFSLFIQLQNSSPCNSQSLDNGLIWMLRDTVKINALLDSGWMATYSYPKVALKLAKEATVKSVDLKWDKGTAKAMLLEAKAHDLLGNFKEALQINFQALTISKRISDRISEANSLRQIGGMYEALGNYPNALIYLYRSNSLCVEINYLKGIASSLSDIAYVYKKKSEYDKALDYLFRSIEIKNKIGDFKNAASTYMQIGGIYLRLNNYEMAIGYQLKSLAIREKIGDVLGIAQCYGAIGETKILENDLLKALEFMHKCIILSIKHNAKSSIANQLANIGLVYDQLGNHQKALKYHNAAIVLQTEMGNMEGRSIALTNLGSTLSNLKLFDSAINYLKKSLEIDLFLGNKNDIIIDYLELARINLKKGDIAISKANARKAEIMLSNNFFLTESRDLAELQSKLFEKEGNFKASLKAYKQFITLRDSAINQNKKVAVALKEAKYEFDKKALADSLKNNEAQKAKDLQIKFKDSELQKQKLKQNAMLAGIVVLFVLGWLLYSRYKAVSLQQVSERKLMLLEKEQALVEERTRIADEMHDDVGADLSNLLLKIRMNEHIQTQSASPSVDLGGLKNSTNGIIHKIDEIIWSLNSHRDTLQELVNFIVKYYDSILKENNLSGKADVQETLPAKQLAAKQRRNIYLTVKEILNNVLKHAQANSIQLKVGFENNILEIKVCDDGNGFDTEKTYQGNGLRNISKRLEIMGGKLEIESKQNVGSTFLLHIPVV